ncbi:hypothetical protein [Corynebacterium urinipleomorphum]|uniref:hypothetical protein n=1 Tax=Corynebacterium urinipleomorphum TaxID=1852380 RepID=UPI000B3619FE|nr:hypothetical protein [Corynebacterium urinipleomorphum]
MGRLTQLAVGAAAGYVMGTKAGRKRYHQIVDTTQKVVNSPLTQQVIRSTRKTIANQLDPDPRMREIKNVRKSDHEIYEPDED